MATPHMQASIEWISDEEANTPRADGSWFKHGDGTVVVQFRGVEAGQGGGWGGSIKLSCLTSQQTVSGFYETTSDRKLGGLSTQIAYVITGVFEDDEYSSFTGKWEEGSTIITKYDLYIDLGT